MISPWYRRQPWATSVALVLVSMVLSGCTQLFFFPDREIRHTPADFGHDYEDVWLESDDGVSLHAWLIEPKATVADRPRGTILFLHGNAENISTHSHAIYWLVDAGYRVLALDYRGYGQSGNAKANVPAVFLDIHAAETWLRDYLDTAAGADTGQQQPVVMLGQSLGAALAIHYLGTQPRDERLFDGLIVEAAFSRWGRIARETSAQHWLTWLFQYPVDWLMPNRYDPVNAIADISPTPLLLIHSADDELIDVSHQQALYAAAREPKQQFVTKGPHIMGFVDLATQKAVLEFLATLELP